MRLQRVIYKGTTAGNRITKKLKDEYKVGPPQPPLSSPLSSSLDRSSLCQCSACCGCGAILTPHLRLHARNGMRTRMCLQDVPHDFKFSKAELASAKEEAQPIPGKYEMWNMSSASKVPNTGAASRLRHATRFNGYKEKDKDFYLDYWPGAGSARFAHWTRGAGWATRMRTLSHEGGHHTST